MGETVRFSRNWSIDFDWSFVSSAEGGADCFALLAENQPRKPPERSAAVNCGLVHRFSASIVRLARARLCRMRYCVW